MLDLNLTSHIGMHGTKDNIIEISLVAGQQQLASQVTTNISQVCTHHLSVSNTGTTSTCGRLQ